jgi:hypothetical protein
MDENDIETSEQIAKLIGYASPTAESLFRLNIAFRETSPFLSGICSLGAIYFAVKDNSD